MINAYIINSNTVKTLFNIFYCGKVVLLLCKGARNVLVPIRSQAVFLNSLNSFNAPGVAMKITCFLL